LIVSEQSIPRTRCDWGTMKVTLDLSKLLEEGKLSPAEAERTRRGRVRRNLRKRAARTRRRVKNLAAFG
jgi:hypothetical protein